MIRAHGLNGEVRVMPFNPAAPNLREGAPVLVGERRLTIASARPTNNGFIVGFAGLGDRSAAEAVRGLLLEAPEDEVRPEPGSYFVHDLIGLRVWTDDGRELGAVTEVLQPGANDVYVVKGEAGEHLVPAIGDVIKEINVAGGRIVITPLPGLLDESL